MIQGFLVALVAALVYMESRIGGQHMLDRPIIIGPLVGVILGDPVTGLMVGGSLELVWMGLVGIGTSTPPDVVVPISLLAQVGAIGVCILNTVFAHRADACAEKGDYRGVEISNWMGSALYFIFKFSMVFIGFMIGSDLITKLVSNIPEIIQKGLGQSGNLLPALGVAMLIQMTWDKKFGAFLFLGFALAAFLNVSTIGAAIFGVVFAVLYFMLSGNMGHTATVNSDESEEL